MKKLVSLLLIISLATIAVFGFGIFAMGPGHAGGCLASMVDGTTCPANIIGFINHHVLAVQSVTRTVVPSIFSWLLLFVSLLVVSARLFFKNSLSPRLELSPDYRRELTLGAIYHQQKFISWLALFELSPAI